MDLERVKKQLQGYCDKHNIDIDRLLNKASLHFQNILESHNQCDGCKLGLPVKGNIHYLKGRVYMGCEESRYSLSEKEIDAVVKFVMMD